MPSPRVESADSSPKVAPPNVRWPPTRRGASCWPEASRVAHEGLLEYELIDIDDRGAHTLALTLLRCTGMLSQGPMATRPLPAGPEDPLEGPQMQGPFTAELILATCEVDPHELVDDGFTPLPVALPRGGGEPRADSDQALDITGAQVSAVQQVNGMLEVRVFNPSVEPARVTVAGRRGWVVDLRGATIGQFDEHLELAPGRIATLRLAAPPTP